MKDEHTGKKGYVKLPNFFSEEEAQQIQRWATEMEGWEEIPGAMKWMIYSESNHNRRQLARIEHFINYHEGLRELLKTRVEPELERIAGRKLTLFKDKLNWKHAGGKGFGSHQDHPAWDDFPSNIYYSVALFANICTVDNGCLEFQCKENITSILPHNNRSLLHEDQMEWEYQTATPRDLFIFDSYAPHRSRPNNTDGSRRIFYFTYNPAEDGDFYRAYNTRKRVELPPDVDRNPNSSVNINSKYNLANPIK